MMRISALCALAGAAVLISMSSSAIAEDEMSVQDIERAFQAQLDAYKSVKTRGLGGNSESRGLKLVTVEDIQTDAKGDQIIATASEPDDAMVGPETGTQSASSTSQSATTGATISAASTDTTSKNSDETVTAAAASASGDPFKPLVYGEFKPEMQVNLHIEFGFDSAALDPSQKPKLQKICLVLQNSPIHKIRIVGHTDASGSDEYNEKLSVLRAREVARHLVDGCGISAARLETIGLGERFPFNKENPKADENRRVEFQALS
jgi:outer membrane protein OmpA-like peptidoglycan-associated protein